MRAVLGSRRKGLERRRLFRRSGIRAAGITAAIAATGVVLASQGSAAFGSAASAPGVTSTTIKLGVMTDLSGPGAAGGKLTTAGEQLAVSHINAHGGIDGRKVKLVVCDNQSNTATAISCAHQLVQQDKVFAIVYSAGAAECNAVMPYWKSHDVPVIACGQYLSDTGDNWSWQPIISLYAQAKLEAEWAVKTYHIKSIATTYPVGSINTAVTAGVEAGIKGSGAKLVAIAPFQLTATDLTAQVEALKSANPQFVLVGGLPVANASFYKTAESLGYKPKYGFISDLDDDDPFFLGLVDTKWMAGTPFVNLAAPLTSSAPGVKMYLADLKKYQPSATQSEFAMYAYQVVLTAAEAIARTGHNPTQAGLLNTLATKMKGWTSYGVFVPLDWSSTNHAGVQGISLSRIEGGKFVPYVKYFQPSAN